MISVKEENISYKVLGFETGVSKLTVLNADELKQKMNDLIDADTAHLILDFTGLMFIDSTGFGSLVTIFNHAKNRKQGLSFCHVSTQTQALLKVTKLDQIFDIYPDLEAAKEAIA